MLFVIRTFWAYTEHESNIKLVENVALAKTKLAQKQELSKELKEATEKWEKIEEKKSAKYVQEKNEAMRKGYVDVVAHLAPRNMTTDTSEMYRYDLWDLLSMMLLGIAFYKWNMLSGKKSYRFYGLMVLGGYAIGLTTNHYEVTTIMASNFSFLGFSKSNLTYDLGRVGMAISHIGMIMIFSKLPILGCLKYRIAAGFEQLQHAPAYLYGGVYGHGLWNVWQIATLRVVLCGFCSLGFPINHQPNLVKILQFWSKRMALAAVELWL